MSSPSSPISTGKVCSSCTTATAPRRTPAGRASDRNEPSSACSSMCTPTSDRRTTSSRRSPASHQSVTFSTRHPQPWSAGTGPGTSLDRRPARRRRPATARARPARRCRASSTSRARREREAESSRGRRTARGRRRRRRRRARPPRPTSPTAAPSTSSWATGAKPSPTAASTVRAWTWRNRTRTSTVAVDPELDDAPRSACAQLLGAVGLGEGPGGEDAELPAHLVLGRRRPVRVEHVALVEHGVGDLAGPRRTPVAAGSRLTVGLLQQPLEGLVPDGQGPLGLVPGERVEGLAAQPDPAAVREVPVHQLPPDPTGRR